MTRPVKKDGKYVCENHKKKNKLTGLYYKKEPCKTTSKKESEMYCIPNQATACPITNVQFEKTKDIKDKKGKVIKKGGKLHLKYSRDSVHGLPIVGLKMSQGDKKDGGPCFSDEGFNSNTILKTGDPKVKGDKGAKYSDLMGD